MGFLGQRPRQVFLYLLTILLLSACGEEVTRDALAPGTTVLAFGDSVTFGTGAGRGEDWPSLLAAASQWNVINAGIPGDTAHNAQHRLPDLLARFEPELVIIELGGNDFLRGLSLAGVRDALRTMVQQSRASGAEVVLVSVPRFSMLHAATGLYSDSPIYEELAEELDLLLAADVFADVLSEEAFRADRIHPNAAGYREFNRLLMERLQDWGLLQL